MRPHIAVLILAVAHRTTAGNGVNTPAAIQSQGFISNCLGFIPAAAGDTCYGIAQREGLSLSDLIAYNPQLGGVDGCAENLIAGLWYCIKTIDAAATVTSPPPPLPKTTPPPSPSCDVNSCYRGFVVATSAAIPSQSSFCEGYLATANPETDHGKIAGIPAMVKTCGAPAELSKYCSCWNAGAITAKPRP